MRNVTSKYQTWGWSLYSSKNWERFCRNATTPVLAADGHVTETGMASKLSLCREEGGKRVWQRETSLTFNVSFSPKEGGKRVWQRETSMASNLSSSHTSKQ